MYNAQCLEITRNRKPKIFSKTLDVYLKVFLNYDNLHLRNVYRIVTLVTTQEEGKKNGENFSHGEEKYNTTLFCEIFIKLKSFIIRI